VALAGEDLRIYLIEPPPISPFLRPRQFNAMTILYASERFLAHDTGDHPECAERLVDMPSHLEDVGILDRCHRKPWEQASLERVAQVHETDYLGQLFEYASAGGGQIESDTVMSSESFDVALLAAGAACDAVRSVLHGEHRRAVCLIRPPGHHALAAGAMGFCLLNNVSVAARSAIEQFDLERVLIVDWDVHHGNGTQDIFWEDPQVGFYSIHRWPFYPGTGSSSETGSGDGLGTTLNIPVEYGCSRTEYIDQFRLGLEQMARKMRPQLVLVSAGFDAHLQDPIGSLGLETEDFEELTASVLDVADEYAEGRIVSLLEGGYNPRVLAACVEAHLSELLQRDARSFTPPSTS